MKGLKLLAEALRQTAGGQAQQIRDGSFVEPREAAEARAATLVPGLFLGRVDGRSPVEYVTREEDRNRVRRVARVLLMAPPARLREVGDAWRTELGL